MKRFVIGGPSFIGSILADRLPAKEMDFVAHNKEALS